MTGLPENNYPAFHEAARTLRLVRSQPPAPTWAEYMRTDLRALLDCEAIALLPGWEQSRGARCEVSIAEDLGMRRVEIGVKA